MCICFIVMESAIVLDQCIGKALEHEDVDGERDIVGSTNAVLQKASLLYSGLWKPQVDAMTIVSRDLDSSEPWIIWKTMFLNAFGCSGLVNSKSGRLSYYDALKRQQFMERVVVASTASLIVYGTFKLLMNRRR
jgi:hypothetical protein